MNETMERKSQVKYAVAAFLAVLVFVLIYKYSLNEIHDDGIVDLKEHLGCICYAVGVLEFSFIVETGSKLSHLNFSWEMMSGMLIMWVVCGAKLVECTCMAKPGKKSAVIVTLGWIFLAIHLFSGLYYVNPYAYII